MEYIVSVAAALVAIVYLFRAQTQRHKRKSFEDFTRAVMESRSAAGVRLQPARESAGDVPTAGEKADMYYAGKAFSQVALMQANGVDIDLHDVEQRLAEAELAKGCTLHQALSMRWGGVQAIGADLILFSSFVEVAQKNGREEPYVDGGMAYLATVLLEAPDEFQRFKRYIGVT